MTTPKTITIRAHGQMMRDTATQEPIRGQPALTLVNGNMAECMEKASSLLLKLEQYILANFKKTNSGKDLLHI